MFANAFCNKQLRRYHNVNIAKKLLAATPTGK